MKIEDIMEMWNKDCKVDETELATESSNIPVQSNTLYGFTFTNCDAYGCTIKSTSAVEALFIVA